MDHAQPELDGRGGGGFVGRIHDVVVKEDGNALTLDLKPLIPFLLFPVLVERLSLSTADPGIGSH